MRPPGSASAQWKRRTRRLSCSVSPTRSDSPNDVYRALRLSDSAVLNSRRTARRECRLHPALSFVTGQGPEVALSGVAPTEYPSCMHVDLGGATALGRRAENQDRWAVAGDGRWALVSDGVGGVAGGATAAELAIEAAKAALAVCAEVEDVFRSAHRAVVEGQRATPGLEHMAATLTLARWVDNGRWRVAGAGDSPAFLVDQSVRKVLSPHTVTEALVSAGVISISEAVRHPGRNSVTRAIGHSQSAAPDIVEVDVPDGANLVLATDGVDVLARTQIGPLVASSPTAQRAAAALVEAALAAGATDNVTVVVLRPTGS